MRCAASYLPDAQTDQVDDDVEVIVKMEAGCERKKNALIAEAVSAMLACDLGLPVPEPFLVQIEKDFAETIPDIGSKDLALKSLGWAFGSKKLPPQFSEISASMEFSKDLFPTAAEIVAFDVLICNSDRRVGKPNCLGNGKEFAIIDHELAFVREGVIGWKPPWQPGGVYFAHGEWRHLFVDAVRGKSFDFQRLKGAVESIPSDRFDEYRAALPEEWQGTDVTTDDMLTYLQEMRTDCAAAFEQITQTLR